MTTVRHNQLRDWVWVTWLIIESGTDEGSLKAYRLRFLEFESCSIIFLLSCQYFELSYDFTVSGLFYLCWSVGIAQSSIPHYTKVILQVHRQNEKYGHESERWPPSPRKDSDWRFSWDSSHDIRPLAIGWRSWYRYWYFIGGKVNGPPVSARPI